MKVSYSDEMKPTEKTRNVNKQAGRTYVPCEEFDDECIIKQKGADSENRQPATETEQLTEPKNNEKNSTR